MTSLCTRTIAFYLPQYHPIQENDRWWGPGFTDWRNVAMCRPRFRGHRQPHIPADLGFYDLRLPEVLLQQASLAKEYGISGFCMYHYWFNGKVLLDTPLQNLLSNTTIDMPFCLCWANENWTRRWDGKENEVLLRQEYSAYDTDEHVRWLLPFVTDPRYITQDGHPLFVIYRADLIPNLHSTIERFRRSFMKVNVPSPYLCTVSSSFDEDIAALDAGIDAIIDFQPSKRHPRRALTLEFITFVIKQMATTNLNIAINSLLPLRYSKIQSYRRLSKEHMREELPPRYIHCVMPTWDNSPRRETNATIIQNSNVEDYRAWLAHALRQVGRRTGLPRVVFINAWNEWAEGCHLEPDLHSGHDFLKATKCAIEDAAEVLATPNI